MKKTKKAQVRVITTVLIILLSLVIVLILWGVVSRVVNKGSEDVEDESSCMGVIMEVAEAINGSNNLTIRRGPGDSDSLVTGYKVFINGKKVNDSSDGSDIIVMKPLDTAVIELNDSIGPIRFQDKIEIAAVVYGTVCSLSYPYEVRDLE